METKEDEEPSLRDECLKLYQENDKYQDAYSSLSDILKMYFKLYSPSKGILMITDLEEDEINYLRGEGFYLYRWTIDFKVFITCKLGIEDKLYNPTIISLQPRKCEGEEFTDRVDYYAFKIRDEFREDNDIYRLNYWWNEHICKIENLN